jgi:hypothetical protein
MRRTWMLGVALATLVGGVHAGGRQDIRFEDMPPGHWAEEAVLLCARLGIFEGLPGYELRQVPGPAERLSATASASLAPEALAPEGIRPRLMDPLAERFAEEIERIHRGAPRANAVAVPPAPMPPPPPRRRSRQR